MGFCNSWQWSVSHFNIFHDYPCRCASSHSFHLTEDNDDGDADDDGADDGDVDDNHEHDDDH